MIEPKDGEWWMCETDGFHLVLMCKGSIWVKTKCGHVGAYSMETVKPLYKMEKAEEPKPRTKVVYEPVQSVHKWQLVKAVEDGDNGGEQIYVKVGDEYDHATPSHAIDSFCALYRKVEKKIDWRDEVVDLVGCGLMKRMGEGFQIGGVYFPEIVIRDIAHFVQPITDKPE